MVRRVGLLYLFVSAGAGEAATFVVRPDGTGDYPTIQAAVDAAVSGDEILLADGTYTGDGNHAIDFLGKAVTVRSQGGFPAAVVVDCGRKGMSDPDHAGFLFRTGEGAGSRVADLTVSGAQGAISIAGSSPVLQNVHVRDGWSTAVVSRGGSPVLTGCVIEANTRLDTRAFAACVFLEGGDAQLDHCQIRDNGWTGVVIRDASPSLRDCLIAGHVGGEGGGVAVYGDASPLLDGCTLTGNRAHFRGGGLAVLASPASAVHVRGCTITANEVTSGAGGGVFAHGAVQLLFEDCVIAGNRAEYWSGGVYLSRTAETRFDRCTITGNRGLTAGGLAVVDYAAPVTLDRTILWGNCAGWTAPELFLANGTTVEMGCVDVARAGIYNYGAGVLQWDGTEIDADPRFCRPTDCADAPDADGLWTLSSDSPALVAPCGIMGALGAECTIAIQPTTWGAIKAQYR